ncbi:MAG: hypothetical protein JNJ71_08890 [Rubrivivax sp.]|nr:hypothetical protein [Rubrivivax sp.]
MSTLMAALVALPFAAVPSAQAQSDLSEASGLSLLPVAISVAAPVLLVAGGAVLTVKSVEASAQGTVWVLERGSDGARASLRFAGQASALAGTALVVTAVSAGWVLSAAGTAVAFIPNEIGRALMHDERIGR